VFGGALRTLIGLDLILGGLDLILGGLDLILGAVWCTDLIIGGPSGVRI